MQFSSDSVASLLPATDALQFWVKWLRTESGTPGEAVTAMGATRATTSVVSADFIEFEEHSQCLAPKKRCGMTLQAKRADLHNSE